jgi:rubrerythrin
LQASLCTVRKIETYIADAEKEGDSELAERFRKIQENSKVAGDQGKQLLAKRLT